MIATQALPYDGREVHDYMSWKKPSHEIEEVDEPAAFVAAAAADPAIMRAIDTAPAAITFAIKLIAVGLVVRMAALLWVRLRARES
jgi:hypothetical protein